MIGLVYYFLAIFLLFDQSCHGGVIIFDII